MNQVKNTHRGKNFYRVGDGNLLEGAGGGEEATPVCGGVACDVVVNIHSASGLRCWRNRA